MLKQVILFRVLGYTGLHVCRSDLIQSVIYHYAAKPLSDTDTLLFKSLGSISLLCLPSLNLFNQKYGETVILSNNVII